MSQTTAAAAPTPVAPDPPPSAAAAAREIAAGRLSPVDLVKACLRRIEAVDGAIHSFVYVDDERALAAARHAEAEIAAGRSRGPLHGIPFAAKDNYDAAGLPTCGGSRLMAGTVAERDATLVAAMKDAGAILLGKLSTWEYGTGNGGEYFDLPIPTTRNPWDTQRFAGGSSTGAGAAVAAGTTVIALGSDTTGSVRLPASACGVVGLRPTHGLLDKAGMIANCYSMDVPGPLAWTVEDAALVLRALAGPSVTAAPAPIGPTSLSGLRIGVILDPGPGMAGPDAALATAFTEGLAVLEELGAELYEIALPVPAAECFLAASIIGSSESAAIHEAELRQRPQDMGFALRDKLMRGAMTRASDYLAAQRVRRMVADALDRTIRAYDAVVTFGACHIAPRLGVEPEMTAFTADTMLTPFSLSGHPSLVQCNGFTGSGLPLHWQIVGRRFAEADILKVAAAYEAATAWRLRRPTL